MLYVPPSGAHTIVPQALPFNLARESWTLSLFETSNYAYFLADTARASRIAQRIIIKAERLKVRRSSSQSADTATRLCAGGGAVVGAATTFPCA